ncbi:MAG: ADP-ribosylation factor-like protein [Promethearchaeota archaeon]
MLRQIHIFHKNVCIFNHSYAMGLGDEELTNVTKIIQSHLDLPMPGKTFQRPVTNYQIFHRTSKNVLFMIVTDLVDQLNRVEPIILKTIDKFNEIFPLPNEILESTSHQETFIEYLRPLQHELHSKVAIVGPTNAGKTELFYILKKGETKEIMNFAVVSNYNIDDLNFDIWDFQLKDNFSLLWTKFISGSDLIILLFDLSNYHLRVIEHFKTFQKQEGKLSKFIIIGNKRDLVEDSDMKLIKNELDMDDFFELSLVDPDVKQQIDLIISKTLKFKERLPIDFPEMINQAERLELEGKFVLSIVKYKEMIKICDQYQDLSYIQTFKDKVKEIQSKIEEQTQLRKIRESKQKFKVPGRISFSQKPMVKSLPTSQTRDFTEPIAPEIPPIKKQNDISQETSQIEDLTLFTKEDKKKNQFLTPDDIKIKIKPKQKEIKPDKPKENITFIIEKSTHNKAISNVDYPSELQKLIEQNGSSLSINLCKQLITDLQTALSRSITSEDLEMVADVFVKNELKI